MSDFDHHVKQAIISVRLAKVEGFDKEWEALHILDCCEAWLGRLQKCDAGIDNWKRAPSEDEDERETST